MNLIVLPYPLNEQVDVGSIKGVQNHVPENTFRYNMDKREHIESVLGDVGDYIVDVSEIVMYDPKQNQN